MSPLGIFVTTKDKFPEGKHFVILSFYTVFIPGDERSRTNPGHGYPAEHKQIAEYIAFTNEADWQAAIQQRMSNSYDNNNFVAFVVEKKASITTVVQVSA